MLERLEVFFGDANNAAARIYARLASEGLPPGCTLSGKVVGPSCEYSHTLSAKVPFAAKRSAASVDDPPALLAEAIVPDPCFWSGELPFLYQAEIELRCGDKTLAQAERPFGVRPLGARKRRLMLESRPWVIRAADRGELPERSWRDWRAADLAMYVERPADEMCAEASRQGVVLIAQLAGDAASLAADLRRLSRWPAVAIAVLPGEQPLDPSVRGAARNLLLAESFDPSRGASPGDWADVVICEAASAEAVSGLFANVWLPVLAYRPCGWRDELAQARRECDLLQRDLAGRGDFAGYLV